MLELMHLVAKEEEIREIPGGGPQKKISKKDFKPSLSSIDVTASQLTICVKDFE